MAPSVRSARRASPTERASTAVRRNEVPIPLADWRKGGRRAAKWDGVVLGVAVLAASTSVLLGSISGSRDTSGSIDLPFVLTSASLLAAFVWALVRSRPAGLFRLRSTDLLFGVLAGIALRLLQGAIAESNNLPFPSTSGTHSEWNGGFVWRCPVCSSGRRLRNSFSGRLSSSRCSSCCEGPLER